jgi:hypothetical protein
MQDSEKIDFKRFENEMKVLIRTYNSMRKGPFIRRFPISSSKLRSVTYNFVAEILEIEFNDGSRYEYYEVPEYHCIGLVKAPSHSAYFYENIRFEYDYTKLPSMQVQNPRKPKKGKR